MTCYENIRKKTREDTTEFYRLRNYFNAIEQDKIKQYHETHGRKKDKKLLIGEKAEDV